MFCLTQNRLLVRPNSLSVKPNRPSRLISITAVLTAAFQWEGSVLDPGNKQHSLKKGCEKKVVKGNDEEWGNDRERKKRGHNKEKYNITRKGGRHPIESKKIRRDVEVAIIRKIRRFSIKASTSLQLLHNIQSTTYKNQIKNKYETKKLTYPL